MDPREKNKQAQSKQQAKVAKKHEQAKIAQEVAQATPEQLQAKLSKRNEDYLFKLHKALVENGQTDQEAQKQVDNLLQEVIDNQIKGIPARQLYGTVATKVDAIFHKKIEAKNHVEFWKLSVDSSLFIAALFLVMFGIMGFFVKHPSRENQMGIVTTILICIFWGILLSWFNQQMMLDKKKRKPMWQSVVILIVGLIVMYVGSMLVQLLPAAINPILPPIVNVILAALVYGIRWLFRHYYHITINTFSGR
ncbi:MAG: DUF1129 domain-containing protein [Lactobacillus sp.]|uniref:DUF1129 domain-containing protein n=1 Tax=Bombilactobacillus bombi TaxID=1303590 RepID=A0A347STM6_9LACO|nr:DUF1129 family protein [Bombilactobacillus bombi]AXX65385.1 DUF1129 domain-containing protein [Bombilactobacillus bombi]MCO6540693.1 DUF1129 domain-containing protein [Lactobacillus sp.]MCO6543616.1 DUF1129 domain-containing protein [Lactobacillus sp.]RHW52212.1 DUF1129 domain-containing protein [Bombilactobacillus bombi]